MCAEAWASVKPSTIENCFRHANFVIHETNEVLEDPFQLQDSESADILKEFIDADILPSTTELDDFTNVDKNLQVCEEENNDNDDNDNTHLVSNVAENDDSEEESPEVNTVSVVTTENALKYVNGLSDYALQVENCPEWVLQNLASLSYWIKTAPKQTIQTKVTDFFK